MKRIFFIINVLFVCFIIYVINNRWKFYSCQYPPITYGYVDISGDWIIEPTLMIPDNIHSKHGVESDLAFYDEIAMFCENRKFAFIKTRNFYGIKKCFY